MRTTFVALTVFVASTAAADAGCRTEGSFAGSIGSRATVERTLTLSPTGANVGVVTERENDQLIMSVFRPSGAVGCKKRGPGSVLDCQMTVRSRGLHVVRITNPLRRTVPYFMTCYSSN